MGNDQIDEIVNDIFYVMPAFAKTMFGLLESTFYHCELSNSSIRVLFALNNHKKITITDLGKVLCAHKPNVTSWVDCLVKNDLACRLYDDNDRRIIYISLTENGKLTIDKCKEVLNKSFAERLAHLNDEDLELLIQTLNNMSMLLNKINGHS
ncbi:DNA-binding MarR family transcriptional regulator [Clostridium acetobutylicum]|uniref:Transcriptional regulator, MarR/EmrR family n=1 Tax=Clostridium acetobutylicum (strain ATCC 824 / DSM 792 / JCM 1419 / IAM 19013 / LMG 5710 / NBRC 13948 / NRRL B-527 / VKM B-1787 / 2291 / W) TaxID=272562 RepID=Q97KP1_CLOAB|nr:MULTISPECIES: MarR family transcriptional regulator [Clostridium]AAK78852.1 Transcriptional regulator, MarR/EmrR family [Clostridium acetobutylicum ATCC 824]ADZ19927.1 Transcriptional regulator, MarR/EmrR family [Clostridium acetobutylicum EA 2018]AEI31485.1 MarR family transcriptional regulator [Clostridium acetobutylicum DSM 1731]AWV80571.1 MarR family transcriptional regulator [Clostridium acetobutylicum]MBC2392761.1 MarR family transcriptional regulator [Clostridium acetobutylicum]